jgi:proteasome alpha subunit
MKPFEVEILVAEVGAQVADDQLYHILYDGSVVDEERFTVLGGDSDAIIERMKESFAEGASLADALKTATAALAGPERTIEAHDLEVAVLSRSLDRRAFQRIEDEEAAQLLG